MFWEQMAILKNKMERKFFPILFLYNIYVIERYSTKRIKDTTGYLANIWFPAIYTTEILYWNDLHHYLNIQKTFIITDIWLGTGYLPDIWYYI